MLPRLVLDVCFQKAVLFFFCGVVCLSEGIGSVGVVVVIAPFCEVVCEFEARDVGGRIFKVDDYELFVFICGD